MHSKTHHTHHRLLGGGVPKESPPAFLLPSPIINLPRSEGTGVPLSLGESRSTRVDEILEKPGRGAGDPLLVVTIPDIREGEAIPLLAGRVMNPVEST